MRKPNIFILGMSKIGKTPLADSLAKRFDMQHVGASEWVRKRFVPTNPDTILADITKFSCEELTRDPDVCVDYIKHTSNWRQGGCVIEGIRNPRDFALLFRPECDVVITVYFEKNPLAPTEFEKQGFAAIRSFVDWHIQMEIFDARRDIAFRLDALYGQAGPCSNVDEIPGPSHAIPCWDVSLLKIFAETELEILFQSPSREPQKKDVHVEIPPIDIWVENRVLHDDDPSFTGWTRAKFFALSSYVGEALTAQVLLENGAVFSYVPFHRVRHTDPAHASDQIRLDLSDLVFHNCRENLIAINTYDVLKATSCRAFLHTIRVWMNATYVLTVDWYLGNDLLHLLKLENGQFALLPSHKVLFDTITDQLPPYKKLHATWRAEP